MLLKKSSMTRQLSKGSIRAPSKWFPASTAPTDKLLEVCIIGNEDGVRPFVFPCCKNEIEWVDPLTGRRMDIQPTHWRELGPLENFGSPLTHPRSSITLGDAATAWRRFVTCVEALPPDQAAPFWQAAQAQAAAVCNASLPKAAR
jgi:hypothetical protein